MEEVRRRKKRTFRANDAEYEAYEEYARYKHQSVSGLIRACLKFEMDRHPIPTSKKAPKKDLEALVTRLVEEALSERLTGFPGTGKTNFGTCPRRADGRAER